MTKDEIDLETRNAKLFQLATDAVGGLTALLNDLSNGKPPPAPYILIGQFLAAEMRVKLKDLS